MGGSDSPVNTSSSVRPLATVGGRLTLAVVLPVLALVLASVVVARFQARPFMQEQSQREVQAAVNLKQDSISEWLTARRNLTAVFAELAGEPPWHHELLQPLAKSLSSTLPDIEQVLIVNASGMAHFSTSGHDVTDLSQEPYFQRAAAGENPIAFLPASEAGGPATVVFTSPIRGTDVSVAGVALIRSSAGRLQRVLRGTAQRYGVDTALVDAQGAVIAESVGAQSRWPDCIADGGQTVCGSRIVPETGWTVLAWAQVGSIVAGFERYNTSLVVTVTVTTALLLLATIGIARSIVVPLVRLQEMSRRIADGEDADELAAGISARAPMELQQLTHTMQQMAAEVQGRHVELQAKALTDPLTSLANRNHLNAEGPRIVEMCARAREACSFLMLDIDHFKRINDIHGHQVGDMVLRSIANCVPGSLRGGDFIARYGGEEFLVILPRTDEAACEILAERVRQTVAGCSFTKLGIPERVTVSVGATSIHPEVHDPDSDPAAWYREYLDRAVREADVRLLRAKTGGRNRVVTQARGV